MRESALEITALDSAPLPRAGRLKLVGARVAQDATTARRGDLEIQAGRIRRIQFDPREPETGREDCPTVDLSGYLVLPGLINAHDHLELNLFPRLGRGIYPNYQRWAKDIYHPDRPPLREHLAVPKRVRLWWGALKNLLCGVTTVSHHNEFHPEIFADDFPVRVVRHYGWAHSIAFDDGIEQKQRATPRDAPFIIHLGEGVDESSRNEIYELERRGALDARTVIVHGVALDADGLALLGRRGAAVVWCPSSNLFTLGATLRPETIHRVGRLALGTDSALTGEGDLLDEVRVAHRRVGLEPEKIYSMVTRGAADVLRLTEGEGTLEPAAAADLIALPDSGVTPARALVEARFGEVELVLCGGHVYLVSPALARLRAHGVLRDLAPIRIEGVERLVRAPVAELLSETRVHLGEEFRLAGKRVSA